MDVICLDDLAFMTVPSQFYNDPFVLKMNPYLFCPVLIGKSISKERNPCGEILEKQDNNAYINNPKNDSIECVKSNSEVPNPIDINPKSFFNRRNVFKSIIRNLSKYARNNHMALTKTLTDAGYVISDIEHALVDATWYKDIEGKKERNKFKNLVDNIVKAKTPLTYILRDSLISMLQKFEMGNTKKITTENLVEYKKICMDYLVKSNNVLDERNDERLSQKEN